MNQNIVYARKSHISSLAIVAIVAPIIVSVVLFFMGYCFLIRRKELYRKKMVKNKLLDVINSYIP